MIRILITLFILLVYPRFVYGQVNKGGVPLVENISTMSTPGTEQNWCAVRDKRGIMYFGNQEGGVIEYDGHFWNLIPTPNGTRIYDMAVDQDGTVYVCSAYEFGYLAPGKMGRMEYVSLIHMIDSVYLEDMGEVWSVLVDSNRVYFSTMKRFFIYDINSQQVEVFDHSDRFRMGFILKKINDRIFTGDNLLGIFEFRNDSVIAVPGGDFFAGMPILTMIPGGNEGEIIVGTYRNGIIKLNYLTGEVDEDFIESSVNEFLEVANVYNGFRLNDTTFIVGTSSGGSFIFHMDGTLLEQFSAENSELLDNSIYSMYFDFNDGYPVLWLTNFGYISKAYFGLPFKVVNMDLFSNSALNSLMVYKGDLYVSNDVGLMKNRVDQNGYLSFEMIEGIADQTFPLLNFKNESTDQLLIGTISGLFTYDGKKTMKIDGLKNMYVRSLMQSKSNPGLLFVGQEGGAVDILKYERGKWEFRCKIEFFGETRIPGNILTFAEDDEGMVWFTSHAPSNLYRLKISETDTLIQRLDESNGLPAEGISFVVRIQEDILVGTTNNGLLIYDRENDRFVTEEKYLGAELQSGLGFDNIYEDDDGDIWIGVNNPRNFIYYLPKDAGKQDIISRPFFMLPNTNTADITTFKGNIWIVKSKQLFVVNKNLLQKFQGTFKTFIRRVVVNGDSTHFAGTFYTINELGKRIPVANQPASMIPEFKYSENDISFFYSSPFYLEEDSIRFSYMLQGFDNEWSRWDNVNYRDYTNLPHGRYNFRVRSRNVLGSFGEEATYEFAVMRPWYLTLVAMFGYIVIAVLLIFIIIKVYTRRLINENIRLEGIVAERTAEVVRQKEELEASIHYASRIQRAILPSQKLLKERVKDYFILFRPRDIVSGDFYWIAEKDDRLYVCAADCTGHGVPGAFMSLLGISFLDEIVSKSGVRETNEILNALRLHVTNSLKQMGENEEETKDGMDLGLLVIDSVKNMIEFSGAYNPCWSVRALGASEKKSYLTGDIEDDPGNLSNGEYLLETVEADRMPIGISTRMDQPFSLNKQKVNKGVTYYLTTDGFSDQFGGANGRKFLKKNLKKLILDIQGEPLNKQKELLERRLLDWMGENPQVDDILIIGILVV